MIDSDKEFSALLRHITRCTGFSCGYYKENHLRRRIQYRLDRHRISDYGAYKKYLIDNPDEYAALFNVIGVNFSEFFRDRPVYDEIEKTVMPALAAAARHRGEKKIVLWSVPCATGEEPYSLAMLAAAAARRMHWDGPVIVRATDIDEEALAAARRGRYPAAAGNAVPCYARSKFLHAERDGQHVRVSDAISRMVTFARHDIIADPPFRGMDLICHRNMLIYVKQMFHATIIQKLYESLKTGGFLILGKTEFLPESHAALFDTVSRASRIFRKK